MKAIAALREQFGGHARAPRGRPRRGSGPHGPRRRGLGVTEAARAPSDALVLFGATGDLAKKKIFPAVYEMARAGTARCRWSASRRPTGTTTACASTPARPSRRVGPLDEDVWNDLAGRITYVRGDYRDHECYADLAKHLADLGVERPLFYLAIPPSLFDDVIEGLASQRPQRRAPGWWWRSRSAATGSPPAS